MSSDETQSALSRAYELVEAGNYSDAQAIVDPILAVTDPEAGRDALENVLRIDPQYPGAAELFAQARQRFPERPKITSLVRPISVPEAPPTLPEVGTPGVGRDTRELASVRKPRRSTLPLVAVFVVIIIVAAAVVVLLTQNPSAPTATPTSIAIAQATETDAVGIAVTAESSAATEALLSTSEATANATTFDATAEPTAVITEAATTEATSAEASATEAATMQSIAATAELMATEPLVVATTEATVAAAATAENAAETFALIEQSLAAFPVAESGVGQVETSLGDTLLVTVCTTPGRAMRSLLPQVMNALALKSPTLGTSVDALGVRMLDCSANTALLIVAVELETAQGFAGGAMSSSDFAASWQPQ